MIAVVLVERIADANEEVSVKNLVCEALGRMGAVGQRALADRISHSLNLHHQCRSI